MSEKKTNWAAYDLALKRRGSITFWMSDEALAAWAAEPTGKRGRQSDYSDLAIETSLSLRLVFNQALRQTEGLLGSIFEMLKVDLNAPDHTTLSRRGKVIELSSKITQNSSDSLVIIIDSTGLKIYGAGEWSETKHGLSKRREWRKLHLAIDGSTLEIIESSLTDNHVGDSTEASNILANIENPIGEFMGDGAYDSSKVYADIEGRDDVGGKKVTIPPRKNAVVSDNFPDSPTQRDRHVDYIDTHGRPAWENDTGYHRRLLVENAMGRFKGIIGDKLRSRDFDTQKNEASIACKILNKMIRLGTPLRPALDPI